MKKILRLLSLLLSSSTLGIVVYSILFENTSDKLAWYQLVTFVIIGLYFLNYAITGNNTFVESFWKKR